MKHVRLSDPGPTSDRRRSVPIPIHVSHDDGLQASPSPSLTDIERQMEAEAEKALKGSKPWESRVKGLTQSTLHIRPRSSASDVGDRTPRRQRTRSTPIKLTVQQHQIPEIDVIRREDTSLLDTSAESLDEDTRRPLYSRCPNTGEKIFRLEFDVRGYNQENISVRVTAGRLVVHAVQKEAVDGRKTTNEFCRKIKLPDDVDQDNLHCVYLDNGKLLVESPVVRPSRSLNNFPSCSTLNGSLRQSSPAPRHTLNKPFIRDQEDSPSGKAIHIHVEVGRVFKSDDVVVKVRGHEKVIVTAEKEDVQERSRLSAKLTREFDLPERILPQSLRAGLTLDGVLKVMAHIEKKPENGTGPPESQKADMAATNGGESAEAHV